MITTRIFKRPRKKLADLRPGETFMLVGQDLIYQVINLTETDGFLAPGPTLRDDVVYSSRIIGGCVFIHQKSLEVEIVNLQLTEVIDVASTMRADGPSVLP